MRISDWSSDVCSSDLPLFRGREPLVAAEQLVKAGRERLAELLVELVDPEIDALRLPHQPVDLLQALLEIGRATCRERVCQYVYISVVAVTLKKKISVDIHNTLTQAPMYPLTKK